MKNKVNLLYIYILVKWNKFAPYFMQASKIFIIFIYESQNNKIYPMWAMFYQMAPNSQKFHF